MELREGETPIELVRRLSPARKLAIAQQLWETARALARAGVRARRPELTEEQVAAQVREIFLRAST
jgi:ketopantoate hydroxymethyltransferase